MSSPARHLNCRDKWNPGEQKRPGNITWRDSRVVLFLLITFQLAGCVSDKVDERGNVASYQEMLADQGPQKRADTRGHDPHQPLNLLKPVPSATGSVVGGRKPPKPSNLRKPVPTQDAARPDVEFTTDPVTGVKSVDLTIEQAVARTLANSPEIRVVSFDPSIARQDITKAASEFDMTAFWNLNYEDEDNPPNSIFQPGESEVQTWDSGIRKKGLTGLEWSLSYGLTRSWDDLVGRTLPTRYEPMLSFQLRQPLLRDAGEGATLAGVNIARLNYKIAFFGFRDKAEDTAAQAISAYWRLLQARRDHEIHQALLDRTLDTLSKVEGRSEIDATAVQIKQTEASTKAREAALLRAEKAVSDAQDVLVRLMADPQLTVLDVFQIVPASVASRQAEQLDQSRILELAMGKNPAIQQARLAVEIADINVRAAKNRRMPRLDLVASARGQGLARGRNAAQDLLESRDYTSYAVGLSLEIPLGNRQREAELLKRRLERRQAIASLQNVADQVAILVKEASRKIRTTHSEIQVQKDAAEAAGIHLQALEDSEPIREQLTPEFLLVKLQAQESLANAQKAEIRSIADFNISLAQLARTLGTVLELHQVKTSLPALSKNDSTAK
jgi:outer membrane protein TolC